jgi:inosine triphosphate pyrophosphatase
MATNKEKLYFCTENANKFNEFKDILKNLGLLEKYDFIQFSISIPEYQGDEVEIAREKAIYVKGLDNIQYPFLIEDTSLGFTCLNGLPGPYIKAFSKKIGNEGISSLVSKYEDNTAEAICTIALVNSSTEEPIIIQGKVLGFISPKPSGNGFGWDPVFSPKYYDNDKLNSIMRTFGDMDQNIKNGCSHRSKAIVELYRYLI